MSEVRDRYVYIYEDFCGTPFYVGVGKGNRMWQHVRHANTLLKRWPHSAKYQFIVDCIRRGWTPEPYKAAENLTLEEAMDIEIELIKRIGRMDLRTGPLLNTCAGGYGVKNYSEKTRALISARTREAMEAPELREHISRMNALRWADPAQREKTAAITKALWQTEDFRAKFFAVSKSKWTPELRARQAELARIQFARSGNPFEGRKHSAESKAKMAASQEKVWTPEARAKAAARMRGKKLSAETRAKMSASQRSRFTREVEAQA